MWALTGNLDIPGGNVFTRPAFNAVAYALPGAEGVIKLKDPEQDKPRIGRKEYGPFDKFIWRCQTDQALDQIFTEKPYPIKGLWMQTCNPLAGIGLDPKLWQKALEKLDFIVGVDLFMTPSLRYADIILPPENHPSRPYHRHRKGLLRADGKPGFTTPSGKFELYCTLREEWDLKPLPYYREPPFTPVSRPDLFEQYPLILSTGRRSPAFFHAEHRNIPWLRQLDPDPVVEIHPETASQNNICHGEWVMVENWLGKAKFKAKVTKIVPPWMVMAAHGWWFPEKKDDPLFHTFESNINMLIPMHAHGDDGLGTPVKHLLCRIRKPFPDEDRNE